MGFVDTPNQRLGVRHKLPIVDAEDLADVPLAERNGKTAAHRRRGQGRDHGAAPPARATP